jgi:hypothetical protein
MVRHFYRLSVVSYRSSVNGQRSSVTLPHWHLFFNTALKHTMAEKENKGGFLSNEQIEKELSRNENQDKSGRSYVGSQDTGDQKPRDTQIHQSTEETGGEPSNS